MPLIRTCMDVANAKIAVMGGEQAAGVLARIRRDAMAKQETGLSQNLKEEAFKAPILEQSKDSLIHHMPQPVCGMMALLIPDRHESYLIAICLPACPTA